MGGGVHHPGEMQDQTVAEASCNPKCVPKGLTPEISGDKRRHDEAHELREPRVPVTLETDHRIRSKVREIQLFAAFHYLRVFLHDKPPHMREEEATGGIVRIRICLRVLVVNAMIPGPVVDAALIRNRIEEHEEDAVRQGGSVGAMRPQTMDAGRDAQPGDGPQDEGLQKGLPLA